MGDRLTTPRRRRWFTVSIRLLMGLILVAAVWLGQVVQRARAQREAVAEIRRLHGVFGYDWRVRNGRSARNATPPGPRWLRKLTGDEPFQEVIGVVLARQQTAPQTVTDATLAYLGRSRAQGAASRWHGDH